MKTSDATRTGRISASPDTWNLVAKSYPQHPSEGERSLATEITELFKKAGVHPGSSILEVGSGSGHLSLCLRQIGFNTDLLDFAQDALDHARNVFTRAGLAEETQFWNMDALALPPDVLPRYELAWNSGVAEHFDAGNLETLLRNMAKTAKQVIVIVPNPESVFYLAGKRRSLESGNWAYGAELQRPDYDKVIAKAGLSLVSKGYLGRGLTEDWIRHSVGTTGDELFLGLMREGQLPQTQLYLQYFVAASTSKAKRVVIDDQTTLDKTFYLDAMGTATAFIAHLNRQVGDLKSTAARLEADSAERLAKLKEARNIIVSLREALDAMRRGDEENRRISAAMRKERDDLARQYHELRLRHDDAEARHKAVIASTSWRVTLPLRKSMQAVRRVLGN